MLIARPVDHPYRGGWFTKCQDLAYLVLTRGGGDPIVQQVAADFYAGPEPLEPTFNDDLTAFVGTWSDEVVRCISIVPRANTS